MARSDGGPRRHGPMVDGRPITTGPRTRPGTRRGPAGKVDPGRTSSRRTGDPSSLGQIATSDGGPNAEPDSSPRRPNGLLRGTWWSGRHSTHRRTARGRAQPRARPRRGDRRRGHGGADHDPAADHRPARWPGADRPRRAGRGALRRQPPERLRRGGSVRVRRSWRSSEAPAPPRCWCCGRRLGARDHRRVVRLLDQPVDEQSVPPAAEGLDVPAAIRGRVVGSSARAAAAAALAALAGGLIADQLGGLTAITLAGLVGLVCALAYAGLARARRRAPTVRSLPVISIQALRDRPASVTNRRRPGLLRRRPDRGAPLHAIVNVDRLDLSLADVGIIGILTAGATTLSFLVWGAVADRRGPLVAMRLGSLLGLGALMAYALAPDVAILWVAAVAAGAGSASIDVGIAAVVSDQTSLASRAAAMAGWNAITGARGIVAAFTMSVLLQVGLVDVTSGLLLCAAISGLGVTSTLGPASNPRHGRGGRARWHLSRRWADLFHVPARRTRRRGLQRDDPLGRFPQRRIATMASMRLTPGRRSGSSSSPPPNLAAPPRRGAGAQCSGGDRPHLRRHVRGRPSRRELRGGRGGRPRRPSPRTRSAGVRELVEDVRLEVLMDDGARLVRWSIRSRRRRWRGGAPAATDGPGAVRQTGSRPAAARARDPRA